MDFAQATVNKRGNTLHVSHGSDDGLYVEFYMEAEHQLFESEQQGIPVYKDAPFVRVMFPGDNTKKVVRPVKMSGDESSPSDIDRWPRQWQAFQNQSIQTQEGTPINEWPPISKSLALNLKSMNIHTVQQLAAVSDNALTWLGARDLREKAKAYIASATDSAAVLRMQTDNDNLRDEIATLKAQFAELAAGKTNSEPEKSSSRNILSRLTSQSELMRTLLQIIQTVVNETGFGDAPGTVIGNTDPTAVQLLALANREGYDLAQADGANEGWSILRKEFTFPTVVSQEAYAFPSDYSYIIGQTEWDRTQRWQLVGPATPQEWQLIKSGLSPTGPRRRFRIMRDAASTVNKIYLNPVPDTVNTIVFEYYTTQWCASSGGTGKTLFSVDTDVPLIDDNLFILGIKWRFLRSKGLPYDDEFDQYETLKQRLMSREAASRPLPLGLTNLNPILLSNANIPDTGFGV